MEGFSLSDQGLTSSSPAPKGSDRLPKQFVLDGLGLCPTFDEISDEDTLQVVLQNLGLQANDFRLVLELHQVSQTQIEAVLSALTYKFKLLRSQSMMSKNVRLALDYLRSRNGKPLFDEANVDDKKNPVSGSFKRPEKSSEVVLAGNNELLMDRSRLLSDLGFSMDEIIGGVLTLGAGSSVPSMISAFWGAKLSEIEKEAPDTYQYLTNFLSANTRDIPVAIEREVRQEVVGTVSKSSEAVSGVDTVGGNGRVSDLTAYMASKGLPVPETVISERRRTEDVHAETDRAIQQMKEKIGEVSRLPEGDQDDGYKIQ